MRVLGPWLRDVIQGGGLRRLPRLRSDDIDSVYLFHRVSLDRWVEVARLVASDWHRNNGLGASVAIGTGLIAVGATGDLHTGSVYLFDFPEPRTPRRPRGRRR